MFFFRVRLTAKTTQNISVRFFPSILTVTRLWKGPKYEKEEGYRALRSYMTDHAVGTSIVRSIHTFGIRNMLLA